MNQTAKIINFERPVVKADTDNGFIMLAYSINIELGRFGVYRLNGRERALIDCVLEKTFRWKKKVDWISESQFSEFMELSEGSAGNINKIKNSLIKRKILISDGKKVGLNTILSEWIPADIQSKTTENKTSQKRPVNQSYSTEVKSNTTENPVKSNPHNRKNLKQKNLLQENLKDMKLPPGLTLISWCEFIQTRIDLKKPFTELAATKFLSRIEKQISEGLDATSLIDEAISNGWQTTYPPKQNKFQSRSNLQSNQKLSPVGQNMAARLANMSEQS